MTKRSNVCGAVFGLVLLLTAGSALADLKIRTKFVKAVDEKAMTISATKDRNSKEPPEVIEITADVKLGFLAAKNTPATISEYKPVDQIAIHEMDGKVVAVLSFARPPEKK